MKSELAYALITPYSLFKSRTGGIISRLLASPELEFVGVRMFVFSDDFIDSYKKLMPDEEMDMNTRDAWNDYLDNHLRRKNFYGMLPRCMLLFFKGKNAIRHIKDNVIGSFTSMPVGNTIRGTFGDMIRDKEGVIHYMEPAVMTGVTREKNTEHLKLFSQYAKRDGGVLTGMIDYESKPETSLVILKPDNFYTPSRKPGNIIDTFSMTGLRIVGAKLFSMTVAQAEEFYGQLKNLFKDTLKSNVSNVVYERLNHSFEFEITRQDADIIAERLAGKNAMFEFRRIVEYMTGIDPKKIREDEKKTASKAHSLALLYEGVDAISKIRSVLGETNPQKAAPGTVRSDFGNDLMRNGAHASDSPENAAREMNIIGMHEDENEDCDITRIIEDYLAVM